MEEVVLIRIGEIFLKKGNRPWFLKRLRRNLRSSMRKALGHDRFDIANRQGRFVVWGTQGPLDPGEVQRVVDVATHTFGVVSVNRTAKAARDFESITQEALAQMARVLENRSVSNFRVEATRADKTFPMTSPQIDREVGSAIVEKWGLPVKLKGAEVTVGINILDDAAYVFAHREDGPGGLPVGTAGKGVILLSGGIDSPVAAWLMAKRGLVLPAIHFHSYPYTTRKAMEKVDELAESLTHWMGAVNLTAICLTPIQEFLAEEVPREKLVLFYRRSMIRLAERLALDIRASCLVTGESLAQVASQTLENITVVQDAATLPILRPLVGMDKQEIIKIARRIGTYEISIKPYTDACTLFLPDHPDTRAKVDEIREIEEGIWDRLKVLEDEAYQSAEHRWIGKYEEK